MIIHVAFDLRELEHVANSCMLPVARLRLLSRVRKHYNMRSYCAEYFGMRMHVLCMSGAAGDGRTYRSGRTIYEFAHTCTVYVGLAQARPNY